MGGPGGLGQRLGFRQEEVSTGAGEQLGAGYKSGGLHAGLRGGHARLCAPLGVVLQRDGGTHTGRLTAGSGASMRVR